MKKTNLVEVKLSFPLYCIANEKEKEQTMLNALETKISEYSM